MESFGARFERLLIERWDGDKQGFAKAIDCAPGVVTQWLALQTGENLKAAKFLAAAQTLRVPVAYLLYGEGQPTLEQLPASATPTSETTASAWPFSNVTPAQWEVLPLRAKRRIEELTEVAVLASSQASDAAEGTKPKNVSASKKHPYLPHQPSTSPQMNREATANASEGSTTPKPRRRTSG